MLTVIYADKGYLRHFKHGDKYLQKTSDWSLQKFAELTETMCTKEDLDVQETYIRSVSNNFQYYYSTNR